MDAASVVIREARISDAAGCLAFLREITSEPDILIPGNPDEWDFPVQDEEAFIQDMVATPNCLMLVVEAEGRIVGILTCHGGKRRALQHAAMLSISLHRDYRDRGLGHQLMQHAIDWARTSGIIRIELFVYVENAKGIHLYEKFGFKVEGRRTRAYYHHGRYIDDLIMALLL